MNCEETIDKDISNSGNHKNNIFDNLKSPTYGKRLFFFLFSDLVIITFSLYISFYIRFEFSMPVEYSIMFVEVLPAFILVKLTAFLCLKIYKTTWRYVGIHELTNIAIAQVASISVLAAIVLVPPPSWFHLVGIPGLFSLDIHVSGFPRSIFFIDGVISFVLFCGLRFSKRLCLEIIQKKAITHAGRRTIIIGAGNTGDMIARDMKRQGFKDYYPIGMLDDDRRKVGTYIHGLKVFGTIDNLHTVVSQYKVEAVIIAIPSLNYKTLRQIFESAKQQGVSTIKIVPRIYELRKPIINTKNLEDIRIEDLLGRQKITVDYQGIENFLYNKVVLITGAGGSIGSEITMQVSSFHPKQLILFDIDETELHTLKLRLEGASPLASQIHPNRETTVFITGDIRDEYVVKETFRKFKPQVVFHAAAYKHVPMMEMNASEAVKTNMFGTYLVAKASVDYQTEKFVLISTDKAVRPTSIMGTTKRMAEYICTAFNESSNTSFLAVRFGNVLGSRGSVLPIFLEQLKKGGPLTVTHRDVIRFFMTIPEAVSLVLQASIIGKDGDTLVLDMGKPIQILQLAEELIRIHGLKPYQDIDIEFTGLRPGEKLFEEILTAEEGTTASKHEKIFIAKNRAQYSIVEIETILKGFEKLLKVLFIKEDYEVIRDMLKKYVKSFERRGNTRTNRRLEYATSAIQTDNTDFQKHQLQFEKLIKDLPSIEDYGLIRTTISNYVGNLKKRELSIMMHQQSKKHENTSKLSQITIKIGKNCFSLSISDRKIEDSIKESLLVCENLLSSDFLIKIGYQENNGTIFQNWKSLLFKGEEWFYDVISKDEIRLMLPKQEISLDATRVIAFLYDAFYRYRPNNGKKSNDFLIHAAGILKHGKGFVFTGASGAGKTTVSNLSLPEAEILSDESIVISEDNGNYWMSQGPIRTELVVANDAMVNLCAIFILVQDKTNSVKELGGYELAKRFMDHIIYVDLSAGVRRSDYFSEKLRLVSALCSRVPVYELRFTKDKGFWKEIERIGCL